MNTNFCIEPAQTMWHFVDEATHYVAHCRLKAPRGSIIIGIDMNHVLIKHGFIDDPKPDLSAYEHIELVAIQLGCIIPGTNWDDRLTFIGVIRLGEQVASYAAFATKHQQTIINNVVVQIPTSTDPELLSKQIRDALETAIMNGSKLGG